MNNYEKVYSAFDNYVRILDDDELCEIVDCIIPGADGIFTCNNCRKTFKECLSEENTKYIDYCHLRFKQWINGKVELSCDYQQV